MENYSKVRDRVNILMWNRKKRDIVRGRVNQMIFFREKDNLVRELKGEMRMNKVWEEIEKN